MVTVIVGTQWGDEGKGRVSNFETRDANVVVRCTGGNNAGHTVVKNGKRYALHLLPSSIVAPDIMSVISAGVVINPKTLIREIAELKRREIEISPANLAISERAHLTLPIHIELDEVEEKIKEGCGMGIGTTKRGIGPTYQDKDRRIGIRMCDLFCGRDYLMDKLRLIALFHNPLLATYGHSSYTEEMLQRMCDECLKYGEILQPYVMDTSQIISNANANGEKVVLEGAQSTFLDEDWGNYPYVTSSNPTASGSCAGAGVGPMYVDEVIGVMKAYTSRVGEGPFPTEQRNGNGNRLRSLGHEYGTTTGRPRRCGWLDLVMIKHAVKINGLSSLAINHMDTIGEFSDFKVCVAYDYKGQLYDNVPVDHENCTPIYRTFKGGWQASGATSLNRLGKRAMKFIDFIEEYTDVPVKYIGVGPAAEQTIVR